MGLPVSAGGLQPVVYHLLLSPEPVAPHYRHQVRQLIVQWTLLHSLARLGVEAGQQGGMPLLMVQAQLVIPSCSG